MGTFTLTNNRFQFAVSGTAGADDVVAAATNLSPAFWTPVQNDAAPFAFGETNSGAFPQRFYRVIAP